MRQQNEERKKKKRERERERDKWVAQSGDRSNGEAIFIPCNARG